MTIEYEFYFKGGKGESSSADFAWEAMVKFIKGNLALSKINKVEIISLNDHEWADDGAFCCFELKGEIKDLKHLVFTNAEILDDQPEQQVHWEQCVTLVD